MSFARSAGDGRRPRHHERAARSRRRVGQRRRSPCRSRRTVGRRLVASRGKWRRNERRDRRPAIPHARSRQQWSRMSELSKSGEDFDAEVVEADRGGLVVDVGLRGFVPLSQLASVGSLSALGGRGGPPMSCALVGKLLPLKVIEADQRRDRLILSEKAAAHVVRLRRKEEAARRLSEGEVLDATVASVTTFGLFVDGGVADGLVHRSEITWDKGLEPTSLCQSGGAVCVLATAVDRERRRISFSIKRLEEDPWARAVAGVARGVRCRRDGEASQAVRRLRQGLEWHRGFDPRQPHRVPSSGIPDRGSTSGGRCACPCGGYRPERRRLSRSIREASANVMYETRTAK